MLVECWLGCRGQSREGQTELPSFLRKAEEGYTGRSPVGQDGQPTEEMLVQQGNGAGGWRVREGPLMQGTRQKPECSEGASPKAKNILESEGSSGCKDLGVRMCLMFSGSSCSLSCV